MSKTLNQQQKVFDEKIKYMQIYLDHMTKENSNLKHQLEDMEITANQNKKLLRDFIESITNKDKIVEKLQCTTEILQERIKSQEEIIKKLLKQLESTNTKPIFPINKNKTFKNTLVQETDILTKNFLVENSLVKNIFTSNKIDNIVSSQTTNSHTQNSTIQQANSTSGVANSVINNKENLINGNNMNTEIKNLRQELDYLLENVEIFYKNKHKNKKLDKSFNEDNISILSCHSYSSNISTSTIKKKINIKEKFNEIHKLQELLNNYSPVKSLILLVDNTGHIWEVVRRNDLTKNSLSNIENISTVLSKTNYQDNNLLNIDIKENYDAKTFNNSEIEISKNTDLNISLLLKDNNDY